MDKTAIFPGSFDPFTRGHQSVVDSGLKIFDKIIIGIGINTNKKGLLPIPRRMDMIRDLYKNDPRIEIMTYDGLTVDFAKNTGAKYILRGLRNGADFEFERDLAQVNQSLYPDLTTVVLFTPPEYAAVSSSFVREIHHFGGETAQFLPEGVNLDEYLK